MLSVAGVMYMDHRIFNKIIGKYGWQFVLMINTLMNKFENLISVKFRESECIKNLHKVRLQEKHVVHFVIYVIICY